MQKQSVSDCLDPFIELCKKFDLKITPQRCAIYKELTQAKNHPTADEMFTIVKKEFPNISYDTVNRTLLTFAEIGLVDVILTKGGPRRFDPDMENHHHFHCIHCGKIVDFYSDEFDNLGIPDHIQDDFTVYTKRVVLNGVCQKCRKKKGFRDHGIAIQNKK
ncbi:MAG: transcriptional repressor [Candidatus Aminicenantes bacterium]|nr:MAG: transcriptional repressor [Candidatus Aminicenantes bacterium]